MSHQHNCVRLVPLFNHLDEASMALIGEHLQHRHYVKGEYIYQMHDQDDALYIIRKGRVRLFRLSDNGREQLVNIMQPGEFMGEFTVFNANRVHEEFAQAETDCQMCVLRRADVLAILKDYPDIAIKLLQELALRLEKAEQQTTQVAVENVASRLAMFLAEQVMPAADPAPIITLPMARKDIASYLGTTPETVSRKFKQLEQAGLIEQLPRRQIKINDVDDLLLYS